jgi:hypothetical protein
MMRSAMPSWNPHHTLRREERVDGRLDRSTVSARYLRNSGKRAILQSVNGPTVRVAIQRNTYDATQDLEHTTVYQPAPRIRSTLLLTP